MRLLLFHTSLRPCGPTNQLDYLLKGILKLTKYKVIVILFKKSRSDQEFVNQFPSDTVTFTHILRLPFRLFRLSNRIHSHGFLPDLVACILKTFFPSRYIISTTVRCEFSKDYCSLYGNLLGNILAFMHYKLLLQFNKIVTCSDSIYNHMATIVHPTRLLTIHNGINLEALLPSRTVSIYTDQSALCSTELKVLSVSPLIQRKNITLNCVFFENLSSLFSRSSYHIYGDGPELAILKIKYPSHDHIKFMGHIPSSLIDYSSYHLFLSLSSSEGFSNSMIEASCYGLHLILSNIPSHVEFSRIYPYCTIIDLNNLFPFSEIVQRKFSTPNREELEKHRSNMSSERMVEKYLSLWAT